MNNSIAVPNNWVTDHGLNIPKDITKEQHKNLGLLLCNIETGWQWAVGDWYNTIQWGDKQKACEEAGLKYKTAMTYGAVAKEFQMSMRSDIPFNHHQILIGSNLTTDERMSLLQKAELGDEGKNGKRKPWTSKKLLEERDKVLGTWVEPIKTDSESPIEEFIENNLGSIPEKYQKQVERVVTKAAQQLAKDFDKQVSQAAISRTEDIREQLVEMREKLKREHDHAIKLKRGIKAFLTEAEFKLIRSCLHPDREATRDRKQKAFDLFHKLATETGIKIA